MILLKFLQILVNLLRTGVMLILIAAILFIAYRGNQPMSVPGAPARITYWQFMTDRMEAAKEIKPSRCGYGMFSFLILVGPFYSGLYTYVGILPDSFLARVTQRDSSIPKGVVGATIYQVPDIWWKVVERLSWSALTKHGPGCNFRPIRGK